MIEREEEDVRLGSCQITSSFSTALVIILFCDAIADDLRHFGVLRIDLERHEITQLKFKLWKSYFRLKHHKNANHCNVGWHVSSMAGEKNVCRKVFGKEIGLGIDLVLVTTPISREDQFTEMYVVAFKIKI